MLDGRARLESQRRFFVQSVLHVYDSGIEMSKEPSTEDRALVERFKSGDEGAFDKLVDKYRGRAYSIAYGLLGNREDAEEVAQDTFVRIHRALKSFRGDAEFTTWMYRIATNLSRNKYRWNRSRGINETESLNAPMEGTEGADGLYRDAPDERMSPDEALRYQELQGRLMDELQKMPEMYREVLVMRNQREMSYEEIAQALSCKLGTVKSRIARARDELRERLEL